MATGLPLCHGDIHESNFIIDPHGQVYAIDFGHICFLPPTFVAFSLTSWVPFTRQVAHYVEYPKPEKNLRAMKIAYTPLMYYNNNLHGKRTSVTSPCRILTRERSRSARICSCLSVCWARLSQASPVLDFATDRACRKNGITFSVVTRPTCCLNDISQSLCADYVCPYSSCPFFTTASSACTNVILPLSPVL